MNGKSEIEASGGGHENACTIDDRVLDTSSHWYFHVSIMWHDELSSMAQTTGSTLQHDSYSDHSHSDTSTGPKIPRKKEIDHSNK